MSGTVFYIRNIITPERSFVLSHCITEYLRCVIFCLAVPLGSIQELPAESCSEIKASEGNEIVNGNYWIYSDGDGQTILAPCEGTDISFNSPLIQVRGGRHSESRVLPKNTASASLARARATSFPESLTLPPEASEERPWLGLVMCYFDNWEHQGGILFNQAVCRVELCRAATAPAIVAFRPKFRIVSIPTFI